MKTFKNMKRPRSPNPGIDISVDDNINKNNLAVKSFMIIIYGLMMFIVCLWCAYKFKYRMPDVIKGFKSRTEPDDTQDKRISYSCSGTDEYENETANSFLKIFMKSDQYNKIFMDQFKQKMSGTPRKPVFESFINKMTEYGKKMSDAINNAAEGLKNYMNKNNPPRKTDTSAF